MIQVFLIDSFFLENITPIPMNLLNHAARYYLFDLTAFTLRTFFFCHFYHQVNNKELNNIAVRIKYQVTIVIVPELIF